MSGRRTGAELVIVGGGVVGLAIAREVRRAGMDVVLLEKGRVGREASWAAAGMLSPLGEALEPGPFLEFGLKSLRLWTSFAPTLEEETGVELEFRRCGKLRLAFSEDEKDRLGNRLRWAHRRGVPARWLDGPEVRKAEPAVASDPRGGLLLEEDYRVDNRALGEALVRSARDSGVEVQEGREVTELRVQGGRAVGVGLADGSRLDAEAVVVAAGAWSGSLEGLPGSVPVHPARGQMVALQPSAIPSDRVLEWEEGYLVPRDDGRVLAGATEERVGYQRAVTAGGIRDVLASAVRLAPELAGAPVVELWSGLRPATPDGLPVLGAHPEVENVFLATGHFRNGILLTPVTGEAMGKLICETESSGIPEEFAPGRLARTAMDEVTSS